MATVKQTKSGNVCITLSKDEAGKLWGILSISHLARDEQYRAQAERTLPSVCESVSHNICVGLALAGLLYKEISPEGKAKRENIPS